MSLYVDIEKQLGSFHLRVQFQAENEVTALLGASGCGKSMTLRCIAGIVTPDRGRIVLHDRVLFDSEKKVNLPPQQRRVGYLFQNYALFPTMTVEKNILCGIRTGSRREKSAALADALRRFRLEGLERHYPAQLSGGQQQRVALARILCTRPEAILLDEPFSALDAKIRQQMREELKKIQAELGITVVFVTHDQEEAMALSHRIVVMNKGKFEQVGTPTEVYDNPATKYVASFIGEMNFIEKDGKTIAVRPEDVAITSEPADIQGCVRTIMVLGHYVEVNVQCGDLVVKCFVDRDQSERLTPGDPVNLKFLKTHIF